ncbi:hypothetical protein PILCRDRAFT_85481 [Piloderma croceum F 1598]|uniref:Uncharacterized protein n=1 Tax=Piloderma croceum (strain F 1598) TaxID=765440 RepID=A0A0C3CER4_PILCF|nr:hypothetical protein PILCRDRAFT_85481 [Piloderma croceum F 1598]
MVYYYRNLNHDAHMYKYSNSGNHGDRYNKYGSYSDYAEPDHCEYKEQYHHDAKYKNISKETGHKHKEPEHEGDGAYKGEVEGHELKELKCGKEETDKYEEERHEPQGLDHEGNKMTVKRTRRTGKQISERKSAKTIG